MNTIFARELSKARSSFRLHGFSPPWRLTPQMWPAGLLHPAANCEVCSRFTPL